MRKSGALRKSAVLLAPLNINIMTELFLTENRGLDGKIETLLKQRLDAPFEIKRSQNGKPYIDGDPLYLNLSHCGNLAIIAISDKPCGVDLELVCGKSRKAVLNSFSIDERTEIENERDFLKHWVVRESYIKMLGSTLAAKLRHLKFVGGVLYDGGQKTDCALFTDESADFVFALCVQSKDEKPPIIKNI